MPRQLLYTAVCLGILLLGPGCQTEKPARDNKEPLHIRLDRLSRQYDLRSHYFDAECLYDAGDLAKTTSEFLTELLPEERFEVAETLLADQRQRVARIYHRGKLVGEITAGVAGDYLPDSFYEVLEDLPTRIHTPRRVVMMNPRLYGQDGCYVSGAAADLQAAQKAGLPLVLPGDDIMNADLSEFEQE